MNQLIYKYDNLKQITKKICKYKKNKICPYYKYV